MLKDKQQIEAALATAVIALNAIWAEIEDRPFNPKGRHFKHDMKMLDIAEHTADSVQALLELVAMT
jgi:hypothetical protein